MIVEAKLALLLSVLATVESGNNTHAWNQAEDAVGILQIRQPVIDDVNKYCLQDYQLGDAYYRNYSKAIASHYLRLWCAAANQYSFEDAARIWNGGPDGWWELSTLPYWEKVKREMAKRGIPENARLDTCGIMAAWQPPQTKQSPAAPSAFIPDTTVASSSLSAPATSFTFVLNASAAKASPSTSFTFTIRPSASRPAPPPASRPRILLRVATPPAAASSDAPIEFHVQLK